MTSRQQPIQPSSPLGGCLSLHLGRVQSAVSGLNFYTVLYSGGTVRAAPLSDAGSPLIGIRGGGQLQVGTWVVLAVPDSRGQEGMTLAVIVGAVRCSYDTPALSQSDIDVLVPNAGFVWDRIANYQAMTDPRSLGVVNANDGTPIDALGGEWSKCGPFGTGIHLGNFLAYIRGSDRCGIWMFQMDDLLRLAARSVQQFTLGREYEELVDDHGELLTVDSRALLPWEALGSVRPGQPVAEETQQQQGDPLNPPTAAPIDTPDPDYCGIFRSRTFSGYLADLEQRFIEVPDLEEVAPRRLQSAEPQAQLTHGVFRQVQGADGSLTLQSAKSICLEKYSAIPVPVRRYDQADAQGDTPDNADFNGRQGTNRRRDYLFGGQDEETAAGRSALGLELHGFAAAQQRRNLEGRRDWSMAQEEQTALGQKLGGATYPDYELGGRRSWMPLPKYQELTIQKDRWEGVRYYASRSAIDMLDDGSLVIDCGYGSQIIMSGGNLMLTAPNDIILAPGRSLVGLVPQDLVLRAGRAADLTASTGDIRLKAERNLQMLGGNSGEGGVLIENRSVEGPLVTEPGQASDCRGIVLRSDAAPICALGKDLLLQTVDGPGVPDLPDDRGGKVVIQAAGEFELLAGGGLLALDDGLTIGTGSGASQLPDDTSGFVSYRLAADRCEIGTGRAVPLISIRTQSMSSQSTQALGLVLDGSFTWEGQGYWRGAVEAQMSWKLDGGISASSSEVTELSRQELAQLQSNIGQVAEAVSDQQAVQEEEIFVFYTDRRAPLQSDGYLLNRDTVEQQVFFSLRTTADLGLLEDPTFGLPQWRWQQYAAAAGQGSKWEEPEVEFPAVDGLTQIPWPGRELWFDRQAHICQTPTFFRNFAFDSAELTNDDQRTALDRRVFDDSYIVNTF